MRGLGAECSHLASADLEVPCARRSSPAVPLCPVASRRVSGTVVLGAPLVSQLLTQTTMPLGEKQAVRDAQWLHSAFLDTLWELILNVSDICHPEDRAIFV